MNCANLDCTKQELVVFRSRQNRTELRDIKYRRHYSIRMKVKVNRDGFVHSLDKVFVAMVLNSQQTLFMWIKDTTDVIFPSHRCSSRLL